MKRRIGKTGVEVTAVGMGAMPLSLMNRPGEAEAIRVLHAAFEQGTDFIDTADAYCLDDGETGHNERLVAKALAAWGGDRKKIRVATKGGCRRPDGDWAVNGDPAYLRGACEKSLANLGVETIFLYQLHAPDPRFYERSVEELARLKSQGKIRHIGISNVDIPQIRTAQKITPIETVQNRMNLFEKRDWKSGLVRFCEAERITYIAHSAAGGHMGHLERRNHPVLKELARKYGVSVYCIMLRWLLERSPAILPIPGASKVSSVTDSFKAMGFELDSADTARIDSL